MSFVHSGTYFSSVDSSGHASGQVKRVRIPGIGLLRTAVTSVAGALTAPAEARVQCFDDRVHIGVRGLRDEPGPETTEVAQHLEEQLAALPCVRWVAVNTILGHAVVATDGVPPTEPTVSALVEAVEAVEDKHGLNGPLPEHPLSAAPAQRAALALAMQLAALPVATAASLSRYTPIPAGLASLVTVVDAQPRLLRLVETVVGRSNAGVVLAGLNAVGHAGSGGLLGLGVDASRHALRTAELVAQRTAWAAAEPRLTGTALSAAVVGEAGPNREAPLRKGPVERYADQAAAVAAASFAVTLTVTRRPISAAGGALAAIPKAPWLAREGFMTIFGRGLARRGTVVANSDALRNLDRIGTVVLDTEALTTGEYLLTDLIALDEGAPVGEFAATAHRLFDGRHHSRVSWQDEWALGPVERLQLRGRTGARAQVRLRRNGARHVLGLARAGQLLAVMGVVPEIHEATEALVGAARHAGLPVLATREHADDAALRPANGVVDGGCHLPGSIRDLQRDGTGVLLVSRHRTALEAADVGVGLTGPDGRPPWGADLYVGTDPAQAVLIVQACRAARTVARQGVLLSQASAAMGGVMTLASRTPRHASRSLLTVNAAAALGTAAGVWSAAQLLRRPVSRSARRYPWHSMDTSTVLATTGGTPGRLRSQQAQVRTSPPDVRSQRPSLTRACLTELANPLTPVLGSGAALSAAVGAVLDAAVIVAVTALSGLIGGIQRHSTDRVVARLRRRSADMARVVRDEVEIEVPAEELVVGDIVSLQAGDVVPADCRLLETHHVEADESALTGESLPVAKNTAPVLSVELAGRTSMVWEGTTIAAGRARAVVVATGTATEAGRAAAAADVSAPPVGVERRLARITGATTPVALGSALALMAMGLLRGRPARETIGAGVGLAVASVPEGLPFLVSAAQLAAARRLSVRGALVRDPRTIEAAGHTDVLCFDKTGTLTHGRISLVGVSIDGSTFPLDRLTPQHQVVLAAALRATPRAHGPEGLVHATDRAVTAGAEEAGVMRTTAAADWLRSKSLPFEPSRGFHATRGRRGKQRMLSVKGAPEQVLDRCATRDGKPLNPAARQQILADGEKLAAEGNRVLAVAEHRDASGGKLTDEAVTALDFLGFLVLADRMRGTAAAAVRRLSEAGVHIVMITGDHPQTAESMARQLGVLDGRRVVTGAELDGLDNDALDALLPDVGVVARGTPVHKGRVVQAFQRLGRTVAMTGDGTNDAPAIRLADIGIAFGKRGTPAARAAADLVVTDDRLETILSTLVEGRAMWASVRQALAILVGGNLGEIGFILLGAAATGTSPLTARQLLLVNLFTDLAPAIAVALRPPPAEAMQRLLHEGPDVSLGTALTDEIVVRATATAFGATTAWIAARSTGRPVRARTVALIALVGSQLGQTLLVGGRSRAVIVSSLASMAALAAVVQTPGLSQFFGCTPLGPFAWSIALVSAAGATALAPMLPPVVRRIRKALRQPR
jgi:magnesium-transporting ATPase (P-type)